jgi:methylmalonyl-CoA mutase
MSDMPRVTEQEWRERVERELGGAGLDSLRTTLLDGLVLDPLYTAAERPSIPPGVTGRERRPGERGWQRCQPIDDPSLELAVGQVRADRRQGVDALWLRLDRVHRLGRDVGGELPIAELGHDGLIAVDAADLAELLRAAGSGPLGIYLDAGGNAIPAAAILVAAARKAEMPAADLRLRLGIDPLGALLRDGELPDAPAALTAEAAALIETVGTDFARFRAMTVSLRPYSLAGASAAQQLAAMLGTTVEYLRWLEAAGIEPGVGIRQVDVVLPMESDFLVGVAKLRAARLLWAKLIAGLSVPPAAPWIHAVTADRTLAARDPWVNMLRVTVQAAAAVAGGADEISTTAFDVRLGSSDDLGRRIARNTQAILDEESRLADTLDPGAGSYAVEALTDRLARHAWQTFREIERGGGLFEVAHHGRLQDAVDRSTHARSVRQAEGEDEWVGVSCYPSTDEAPQRDPRDPQAAIVAARHRQAQRAGRRGDPLLEALRANVYDEEEGRDGDRVSAAIEAADAGATLAEIGEALRPGADPTHARPLRPHGDERIWEASHGEPS